MNPASPSPEDHAPTHTLTAAEDAASTGPLRSAVKGVLDRTVSTAAT